ncbi:MAG: hypothetical protein L6290_08235 [Thermodesulfovibrionales bacterium]|nr:hypothetical protein [Thermodesulfovibrionales bacterium]
MKMLRNEKGFIKVLFVILLLIFLGYAGFQFGMPYFRHSAFKADVKELARVSLGQVDKTKAQVFERAQELNIPVSEEDIKVSKTEKTVIVTTAWSETVDILGFYQKRLNFDIRIEE